MSLIFNTGAGEEHGGSLYNGVATQSLRFDDGRNTELTRSPAGATDQKKYTLSCWVKRANLGSTQTIFSAGNSGTGNPGFEQLNFTSGDALRYYRQIGSVGNTEYITTQLFRDPSAWYNIVVMMDAANTIGYIYVNGVRVTSFSTTNHPTNADGAVNSTQKHAFGNRSIDGSADFDGYLAEVNFLDGLIVGETSGYLDQFGEVKNGVWIPKAYSGSYGTNGFRLQFEDNAVGTPENEGVEEDDNIGRDSSGEHNHFTSAGIVASDCAMPDSPENNFCTWNGLFRGGEQSSSITATSTLSEGNLQVSVPGNSYMGNNFRPVSGKWYCEFRLKTQGSANGETDWGWFQATTYADATAHSAKANKWGVYFHGYFTDHIQIFDESTQLGSNINLNIVAGNVLQLALDIDNGKGWVGINNTWYRTNASDGTSTDVANGTNQTFTFTADEAQNLTWYVANGTSTDVYVANFGQDSTFGGDETATTNADANGIGAFHHAPPTDFLALCSANLPELAIGPNSGANEQSDDYFNTVLYTGNGANSSATQDISGVGFKPDWLWTKRRNSSVSSHNLRDSSRDANGLKHLQSDSDGTEDTENDAGVTAFLDDGFRLKGTNAGSGQVNADGVLFVAWNWLANGGTTVTNEAGSIDSTVQANTKAGFSIVLYTGNADASATIGHGLGVVPKIIMVKQRDEAGLWIVFTETTGKDNKLNLNATTASATSALFNNADPTDQVFSVKDTSTEDTFGEGHTYVAYCFAEVEGYSKFGSYIGNGDPDGTFVYLGFRPAWIMIKRSDASTSGSWAIFDNKRDATPNGNPNDTPLFADGNFIEENNTNRVVDFLSNGFKLRSATTNDILNVGTMIYMAFAEAPFKYANAR